MQCTYTVRRTGDFFVHPSHLPPDQCGPELGTIYTHTTECSGRGLDGKGFIIDNGDIRNYFDTRYNAQEGDLTGSCENMAYEACLYFLTTYPRIDHVKVSIQSSNVSTLITCEMSRSDAPGTPYPPVFSTKYQ